MVADYTVDVVDRWGQRLGGLPKFTLENIQKELNAAGQAPLSIPIGGNPTVPTNLVPDPSFENLRYVLNGWTLSANMGSSEVQAFHGITSLRFSAGAAVTQESSSPTFPMTGGIPYVLAGAFYNQLTAGVLVVAVREFDINGTLVATTTIQIANNGATWLRPSSGLNSNAATVTGQIIVSAQAAVGTAYVDAIQLETGTTTGIFTEGIGGPLPRVGQDEIRILRNGVTYFQGPVTDATADMNWVRLQVEGLAWWLKGRVFGRLGGTNLITVNASFDQTSGGSPVGWLATGLTQFASNSVRKLVGANSVEIHGTNGGDGYIYQAEQAVEGGVELTLRTWFFIRSDVAFGGPALEDRGVMIYLRATNPVDATFDRVTYFPLRDNTPRGLWLPAVVSVTPPTGVVSFSAQVRLYAGDFSVLYDQVSMKASIKSTYKDVDQNYIIKDIVEHSKDPAYGKTNHNIKSELNPLVTGINRTRTYEHSSHASIWNAITDFSTLFNGVDVDIELTNDGATRTLTTYFPRKGSFKATQTLELGRNIAKYSSFQVQGRETAQAIAEQGTSGDQQEEIAVFALEQLAGAGIEKVVTAPEYATVDQLIELAQTSIEKRKVPPRVAQLVSYPDAQELISNLFVGDTVKVRIDNGWVQLDGTYKVTALSLNPNSDTLTVTVEL